MQFLPDANEGVKGLAAAVHVGVEDVDVPTEAWPELAWEIAAISNPF